MLDPDIQALVELGDNIAAVGLYQQRHGGSVLVAHKAIEAARRALTQARGAALDGAGSELDGLIERGDRSAAIERHRETHGSSLQQAHDAIEARAAALRPAPAGATVVNDRELDEHLRAGLKIPAIKRYREVHGVGLQEARDAVEALLAGASPTASAPAPPPGPALQPELDRLIAAGQKIMAIKHYREATGVGLKEAKDAVEARMVDAPPAGPAQPALQPELDRLIAADQKIMAIKHYREVTGVGLKEAKDAVEARMEQVPRGDGVIAGLQPELDTLLESGQLIAAIKHYRTVLPGTGLKEAKDVVEAHDAARRAKIGAAVQASLPGLQPELDRLIGLDQKINAIKHYRTCTSAGLKEAKDAVEARMAELGR